MSTFEVSVQEKPFNIILLKINILHIIPAFEGVLLIHLMLPKMIIKVLFILSMAIMDIYFVAYNCITKFLDDGIMIEVSTIRRDGIQAPAITLCRTESHDW